MPKVAILGAGPAGLSAAKYLANRGIVAEIFEKSNRTGGLHRSVEIDGLHYDVGTFVFVEHHELLQAFPMLRELMVPINYTPRSITPNGSVDLYPFTLGRYIKDHGWLTTARGLADLLVAKLRYRNFQTVSEFAYYYMGKQIYHQSGLKDYIYRLHGAHDDELDIEFAKHRMTQVSAMSFRNQIAKKWRQTTRKLTGKKIRRLKDRFARPASGFEPFYHRVQQDLESQGVPIHFNTSVDNIHRSGDGFTLKINGTERHFDRVISTLPLPVALRLCNLPTADVSETRSLMTLFYRANMKLGAPVIFNFTPESEWKRITVFSKFYGMPQDGRDYLSVEITGDEDSDEIVNRCREDFEAHAREVGLFEGTPEFVGHHYTPFAYPVYRKGITEQLENDKQRLAEFGIDSIGRHGNFEYVISHFVALAAKELIEKYPQDSATTDGATVCH